jgi:hypothetical protein
MNYSDIVSKPNYRMTQNGFCEPNNSNNNYEELPEFKMIQNKKNDIYGSYYCGGSDSNCGGSLSNMVMKDIGYESEVSKLFFSRSNINRLQNKIKTEVQRRSDGKFKLDVNQDDTDMVIAMRAIFLDNTKNLPHHIVKQVKELNNLFIKMVVPDIMTNIKQQYDYIDDISRPLKTIPRPLNVNRAGRKSLPSTTTIWGFGR